MKREMRMIALGAFILVTAGILLVGCGGGGGGSGTPPVPSILNINSSTTPASPVSLPVEINGSGFQSAPGKVTFTQGSIVATVVPSAGGWSDTGIVVTVPSTGSLPAWSDSKWSGVGLSWSIQFVAGNASPLR